VHQEQQNVDFGTFIGSSLAAAFVAFLLNRAWQWQDDASKSRATLRGILLELNHAEDLTGAYLRESENRPWSPGYRIHADFLRPGIPALAERGHISHAEATALHRFLIIADEANRSLDTLAGLLYGPREFPDLPIPSAPVGLHNETSRARGKFQHVVERLPEARKAATAALSRLDWFDRMQQ
jgi:hypothetical protein